MKDDKEIKVKVNTEEVLASEENTEGQKDPRRKFNVFALLALLLAVVSWIALPLNERVAMTCGVIAFISGCIGLKSSTRTLRNAAITSLVASSVLIVVLASFLIVIYIGLNSI